MAISRVHAEEYTRTKLFTPANFDIQYQQASADYIQKKSLTRGVQSKANY